MDKRFKKAAIYLITIYRGPEKYYKVVTGNNKLATCCTEHNRYDDAMKMAKHHKEEGNFPTLPIVEITL